VHVLDDEQQWLGPAEQLEGGVHGREQVRPVEVALLVLMYGGGLLRQHPAGGHQPGDRGDGLDERVGQGGCFGGEAAEGLAERQVGQGAVAEVQTVPDQDPVARVLGPVPQLGEQAGLADAGVAGQEHGSVGGGRRAGGARQANEARQPVELSGSADQRASDIGDGGHVPHHRGNE
jgi:hypothetical protein